MKTKFESYKDYYKIKKYDYDCVIHTDGGCRGNNTAWEAFPESPGAAAFVVVKMPDLEGDADGYHQYNHFMYPFGKFYRGKTNNEVEYEGLILALKQIKQEIDYFPDFYLSKDINEDYKILIQCDSQLIVNQSVNNWAVNTPHLIPLNTEVKKLKKELTDLGLIIDIKWFPRAYNLADPICNLVMDCEAGVQNVDWTCFSGKEMI